MFSNFFEALRLGRELLALGQGAVALAREIAKLFHGGSSPEELAAFARSRAVGLRAGQAAYDAAKNAGPKR